MPDAQVAVTQHQWVKIEFCPVQVLQDDTGDPVIFVDPDDQVAATEDTQYGCLACDEPLAGNMGTECSGGE